MRKISSVIVPALLALAASTAALAEDAPASKTRVDLYGFAMLDMGYQSAQNDPDWYDVLRPTKLPAFEDEFGEEGLRCQSEPRPPFRKRRLARAALLRTPAESYEHAKPDPLCPPDGVRRSQSRLLAWLDGVPP